MLPLNANLNSNSGHLTVEWTWGWELLMQKLGSVEAYEVDILTFSNGCEGCVVFFNESYSPRTSACVPFSIATCQPLSQTHSPMYRFGVLVIHQKGWFSFPLEGMCTGNKNSKLSELQAALFDLVFVSIALSVE